jgi:hypothetical protein
VAQSLVFCVMVGRLLVGMTQSTKDCATRTPLKFYLASHRRLKIEPHEAHKKSPKVGRLLVGFVCLNLKFSVSRLVEF